MTTKHIINEPDGVVAESIQGLCLSHPHLRWIPEEKVVVCADMVSIAQRQVTLVAGGGSGHEPGFAGYVGNGMLTAAVCGHIFASPSTGQILAAIERVQSPFGTLVVVMNYTGDCLNFGLAVERAKARGIKVDMVIIGDDISVGRNSKVGRRGMAGTVLAIKAAGALARQGKSLSDVRQMAEYVNQHAATLGIALDHCHVPGGSTMQHLPHDEIELGMGIHNEPGCLRSNLLPAKELVDRMVGMLVDQDDIQRSFLALPQGQTTRVTLMVNNLGGISNLELNLVVKQAVEAIKRRSNLEIQRVFTGQFLTSLNMPGVSITLLALQGDLGDRYMGLLEEPVQVAAWPYNTPLATFSSNLAIPSNVPSADQQHKTSVDLNPKASKKIEGAVRAAANSLIDAEPEITSCDTVLGDGDCGITLKTAATAVLEALPHLPLDSPSETILGIAEVIERSVGGTSSAIYCIYLNALGAGLAEYKITDIDAWSNAASHALDALQRYTLARVGDRTLMDALIPFVNTLDHQKHMASAVVAAREGCDGTRHMLARMGRASYLSDKQVKESNLPDAGALGLAILLEGMAKDLQA